MLKGGAKIQDGVFQHIVLYTVFYGHPLGETTVLPGMNASTWRHCLMVEFRMGG